MFSVLAASLLALAQAQAAAPPAAPNAPITTEETPYQAWMMRCETRAQPQPETTLCGVTSTVTAQVQENEQPVILTKILLRPAKEGAYQLSFELPLAVLLPAGAQLTDAQGEEIIRLPFITCQQTGCEAGAVLTPEQLQQWLTSPEKATVFYSLSNGKRMKLDFSMAGMDQAFAHLERATAEN